MSQPQPACPPDDSGEPDDNRQSPLQRQHASDALSGSDTPFSVLSDTTPNQLDSLTGLGNRHQFHGCLERQHGSSTEGCFLLLIDMDGFGRVNDTLGHDYADRLLQFIADRLRRSCQPGDELLRMGADEFLIAPRNGVSRAQCESQAAHVIELLSRPFLIDGKQTNLSASIGLAQWHDRVDCAMTLLQHADLALQAARDSGRGQLRFFESQLAEQAQNQRELELALHRALALNQFRVVYQPQLDLHTGRLCGFEALLRWTHPELGEISPADFIPVAEQTGDIREIGTWVLQQACQQACAWPESLSIAVNVSPLQFDDGRLRETIARALQHSSLAAERLEVEVTEGLLFKRPDSALEQLSELSAMGISIAMDDFGTGFSSLSHLSHYPFGKVKIDQSFVRGTDDDRQQALLAAIVQLGRSLGMQTLAEGVETDEQLHYLTQAGCDAVQGYLISRPLEAIRADELAILATDASESRCGASNVA